MFIFYLHSYSSPTFVGQVLSEYDWKLPDAWSRKFFKKEAEVEKEVKLSLFAHENARRMCHNYLIPLKMYFTIRCRIFLLVCCWIFLPVGLVGVAVECFQDCFRNRRLSTKVYSWRSRVTEMTTSYLSFGPHKQLLSEVTIGTLHWRSYQTAVFKQFFFKLSSQFYFKLSRQFCLVNLSRQFV